MYTIDIQVSRQKYKQQQADQEFAAIHTQPKSRDESKYNILNIEFQIE